MSRSRRVQMAASVVLALFAGCGGGGPAGGSLDQSAPDVAGPLSVVSADPIDPIPIDEGSALELAVDWGMEPEEALQILQFRAQFEAVPADMDDTLGDRLVYGGHVAGKPEYVFYVMEIVEGDARWLEEISAAGLGGTVTIEVNPGFPVPSGPCLDRRATVTGSWLEVSATAGGDTVEASYGHGTIGYCPGDDRNDLPGMESDGFYLTIDDAVLDVGPGESVTVTVSGLSTPLLDTTLEISRDHPGMDGDHSWDLVAPDSPGAYDVGLSFFWAEGEAHYRIRLVVVEP